MVRIVCIGSRPSDADDQKREHHARKPGANGRLTTDLFGALDAEKASAT
jgi:hypothetical protein